MLHIFSHKRIGGAVNRTSDKLFYLVNSFYVDNWIRGQGHKLDLIFKIVSVDADPTVAHGILGIVYEGIFFIGQANKCLSAAYGHGIEKARSFENKVNNVSVDPSALNYSLEP